MVAAAGTRDARAGSAAASTSSSQTAAGPAASGTSTGPPAAASLNSELLEEVELQVDLDSWVVLGCPWELSASVSACRAGIKRREWGRTPCLISHWVEEACWEEEGTQAAPPLPPLSGVTTDSLLLCRGGSSSCLAQGTSRGRQRGRGPPARALYSRRGRDDDLGRLLRGMPGGGRQGP